MKRGTKEHDLSKSDAHYLHVRLSAREEKWNSITLHLCMPSVMGEKARVVWVTSLIMLEGRGHGHAISKQKYSHTHHTHRDTKILHTSHTHRVMITRGSTRGSRRTPHGERRMSRSEACAARGPRSERCVGFTAATDATRHVRQQLVGHGAHTVITPTRWAADGRVARVEGRRTERREECICPPQGRGAWADEWRRRGPEKNDLKKWPSIPCRDWK